MKLKTKELKKGGYIFTGSKVLRTIMDTSTPLIDLLIRESVQNSVDAIKNDCNFAIMNFNYGSFDSKKLLSYLSLDDSSGVKNLLTLGNDFISISDENTTGLMGGYKKDELGPNNFYNLVYDHMNGKADENAGGSWGIGKSVYYKMGIGLCFFYTRTYENGVYIDKLAGSLIQNEEDSNCLLGKDSSGIAFFGDIDEDFEAMPIYDTQSINDFLEVFGLQSYKANKTGTILIIPFIDKNKILEHKNNQEYCSWSEDIVKSLSIAIQRWYFPRLNNVKYDGKFLKCLVNGKYVVLNSFFKKMQDLYNKDVPDSNVVPINIYKKDAQEAGYLSYKLFTKEELGVQCPPNNSPSPYSMVDIVKDDEEQNKSILFYTRKPGMIVTYEDDGLGEFYFDDKYLIGIFVLNDSYTVGLETLGSFIRKTEKANHKKWDESKIDDMPNLSKKNPVRNIKRNIKNTLKESYLDIEHKDIQEVNSALQGRLGRQLLPPESFGEGPSIPKEPGPGSKPPKVSKKRKYRVTNDGFAGEYLLYTFEFYLEYNQSFYIYPTIKTNRMEYRLSSWEDLGFKSPISIDQVLFNYYSFDDDKNIKKVGIKKILVPDLFGHTFQRNGNFGESAIYQYKIYGTTNNSASHISIKNVSKKDIKLNLTLYIKPIDITYGYGFDLSIVKGE